MYVTAETFQTWANKVLEMVTDRTGNERHVLVVPASFCAMGYVNDERYLPKDDALKSARLLKEGQNNVNFYQMRSSDTPVEFESPCLLTMKAIKPIELNEELYVDYGSAYDFADQ